jgi:serpin B
VDQARPDVIVTQERRRCRGGTLGRHTPNPLASSFPLSLVGAQAAFGSGMRSSFLLAAALLLACSSESKEETPTTLPEARSALSRDASPNVSEADRATFVADNSAFAVDLLRVAGEPTANALVSPHSVSTALAMTYAGAAGTTRDDIARALRFTLPEERLHPAFNWIDLEVSSRALGATGKDGAAARLNVENALFAASDAVVAPPYLDTLATSYGAGVKLVDFARDSAGATAKINAYIEEKTESRIKDLLSDPLDPATRFVLVNTVYANAAWMKPFQAGATAPGPFTTPSAVASVPMMRSSGELAYATSEAADVVELPLSGGSLVFDVVLPRGSVADYEAKLTGGGLTQLLASASPRLVSLTLPKFRLEPERSTSLKEALSTLGMASAFGAADFSRMLPNERIRLADVVHKTFLKIDENGLEAAAATAVIGERTSAPIDAPVTFVVDRPFVVVLRDRPTGQILFLGHVLDPR